MQRFPKSRIVSDIICSTILLSRAKHNMAVMIECSKGTIMKRLLLLLPLVWLVGCGPGWRFKSEDFIVAGQPLALKGWVDSSNDICVQASLGDRPIRALQNMALVDAGGQYYPSSWDDRTPARPVTTVGFGIGVGSGHWRGPRYGAGFGQTWGSYPRYVRDGVVTDIQACWRNIAADHDPEQTRLRVSLVSVSPRRVDVVTQEFEMKLSPDEQTRGGDRQIIFSPLNRPTVRSIAEKGSGTVFSNRD